MMLSRLKIRTRIYTGFGSLVVLGLVVAAVGSWGIDGLGRQNSRMNALTGNLRYVAAAVENEELIARILLRTRNEPEDDSKPRFHESLEKARQALTEAKAKTLSAARKEIYQAVLEKLDVQAQSADRSFDLARAMVDARARLFSAGDTLTAVTAKLVEASQQIEDAHDGGLVTKVERAALLMRVANWRFLATRDTGGPATFQKNVATVIAALDAVEKFPQLSSFIPPVRTALTAYAEAFAVTAPALLGLAEAYDTVQRPMIAAMLAELAEADDSLGRDTVDAAVISTSLRDNTTATQLTVAGLGLVSGLLLAFFIGRSIAGPIAGMTAAMGTLAAGNHEVAIPGAGGSDEVGDMARAVEVFRTNMIAAERLAAQQEAARATRSRRQDAMDRHTKAFGDSVTGVMAALATAAGNMREGADIMTNSATSVHAEASETASGAGKSSADLTAVAAAVEQFTASVGEISRQVAVASDVATQAVQRAEASQATIRGLADSTARIGDVVRLIDSIAGQTNLLALNATIEAARAGDAGKGFAVVAGEVKALAAQTAKATAEIGAQIETVRDATEQTVAAMNEIGGIIGRMGEVSTAISAAVEEQSVTTREIASAIQDVAGSTAEAAQAMGHVVQVADQAGDASRNILSEANEIGSESEKLRREVEQFLQAVQTDSGERRLSERIAGQNVAVTFRLPGAAAAKAVIRDISRTGIALCYSGAITVGRDVEVDLPDAGGPVTGRVTRAVDGIIAVAFSEAPSMLGRVDRALASLSGGREAA
jgi:methyl-accepting chemotaxis protein